jgi:hypothetical protein
MQNVTTAIQPTIIITSKSSPLSGITGGCHRGFPFGFRVTPARSWPLWHLWPGALSPLEK